MLVLHVDAKESQSAGAAPAAFHPVGLAVGSVIMPPSATAPVR